MPKSLYRFRQKKHVPRLLAGSAGVVFGALLASTGAAASPLGDTLQKLAPNADKHVLSMAAEAMQCAEYHGQPDANTLAVIDYSKPSTARRLWVFDLSKPALLFHERVAHGSATGDDKATFFSNKPGSHASSIGLYRTANSYYGSKGYALRLKGLEDGVNDNAYRRAIVMHGADYAKPSFVKRIGRLGRSWGCPAVRPAIVKPLINSLKGGQYLFAYYPKPDWIKHSDYLHCTASQQAQASR